MDTDFDHSMESFLMGYPENIMPLCVRRYNIFDDAGNMIWEINENHHSRNEISFENPVLTSALDIQLYRDHEKVPVSLFGIHPFDKSMGQLYF